MFIRTTVRHININEGKKMITKKTQLALDREIARMRLREIFAGQTDPKVYTILRHVSSSGLSKDISLKTVEDGQLIDITWTSALALGDKVNDRNGQRAIRVSGGGMDLGYHLVHNLSMTLYGVENRGGYTLSHDWA